MSFSDMMESGRGPGVIGMLLALVVLSGFVLLYFFVFDEGMQGAPKTIESVIRLQAMEIDNLKEQHKYHEGSLNVLPKLEATKKELSALVRENRIREGQIKGLNESLASATNELEETGKRFENYKNDYRSFVRDKAKGREIPRLETSQGNYENVTIREVTAIGAQIRYDGGLKRIPYEELPADMQDYYQFDAKQKSDAIADEITQRNQHESEVAKAGATVSETMTNKKEQSTHEDLDKIQKSIITLEARVAALKEEIVVLNEDRSRAATAASKARAMGRSVLDKTGEIDRNIASKKSRLSAMQLEISKLKSSL